MFYEEEFKAFNKAKVKYVLVGGIAVNLLGSLRTTGDLDILVEMSDENLAKIVRILKKYGYKVRQPVDPMEIANRKIRKDWIRNKHMKAFNFYNDGQYKEVDLIIDSPVSYRDAKKNAILMTIGNLRLPVVSIDDLIVMKKAANRNIDKADIQELRLIKKFKGKK